MTKLASTRLFTPFLLVAVLAAIVVVMYSPANHLDIDSLFTNRSPVQGIGYSQTADVSALRWQAMGEHVPLKRTGDPRCVGRTVVYLAENDYITGAVIPVDGGEHLIGSLKT